MLIPAAADEDGIRFVGLLLVKLDISLRDEWKSNYWVFIDNDDYLSEKKSDGNRIDLCLSSSPFFSDQNHRVVGDCETLNLR